MLDRPFIGTFMNGETNDRAGNNVWKNGESENSFLAWGRPPRLPFYGQYLRDKAMRPSQTLPPLLLGKKIMLF